MNPIQTRTYDFTKFGKAIQKLDPAQIAAIGVNPDKQEVIIHLLQPEILDKARTKEVSFTVREQAGYGYFRGLVINQDNATYLAGMDQGFADSNSKEFETVKNDIVAAMKTWNCRELHLVSKSQAVDYFLDQNGSRRKLDVETVTFAAKDRILASVKGRLMSAALTNPTDWQPVTGMEEQVRYLGRTDEQGTRPIVTLKDGRVATIQLSGVDKEGRLSATRIRTWGGYMTERAIGGLAQNDGISAAVKQGKQGYPEVSLFPSRLAHVMA